MSLDERIERNRRELLAHIGGKSDYQIRDEARRFNAAHQYQNATTRAQVQNLCNSSYKFKA
ncbi:hypothetical protein Xoosp14_249 [Xanthomonas phage Xoo-sp14]|nr:hypothetical protein Xoosp14_249 [Xanthomonas phage Xoo-sp14]